MASACSLMGKSGCSWVRFGGKKMSGKNHNGVRKISCTSSSSSSSSSSVMDPYKTLRIHRGASESEVRKAFRQLALQYHPDVCKGNNCGMQFHLINEAYDVVMSHLRGETEECFCDDDDTGVDEPFRGMNDPDWDLWEEWMGWEGAGIRDYSSHINPYI